MKMKLDVYERIWCESEKTAENGWMYDKAFGTRIQVVKYPRPIISMN